MSQSRVLLLTSDVSTAQFVEAALSRLLPEVSLAVVSSIGAAMANLASQPCELVLLSIVEEVPDLLHAWQELRTAKHLSTPAVLLLCPGSVVQMRADALEVGVDDVLELPTQEPELVARIRVLLRVRQLEGDRRAAHSQLEEMVAERTAALLASEARYRQAVEALPDMIALCEDGRIVYMNEAGRLMLRASSAEDIVGNSLLVIVAPESRRVAEQMMSDASSERRGTITEKFRELRLRPLDGGLLIDVEATLVWLEYLGRKQIQLIARDVTERNRIENQIRQSQRMEAVGKLAGGVAHDFNNVLTTIRGFSELILDSLSEGDPLCDDVGEIRRATERAGALTRQLLAFSRRQVLEPKPLSLNNVVTDMKRMLLRIIGEDIELITHLEPVLGTIKADRSQIEQVIMNLVVNGRDAMQGGGKLVVRTSNVRVGGELSHRPELTDGDHVLLEVTDTGVGMTMQTMQHIYEPFFTTKAKDKGTGLGLSTVYGIVKQSGGEIFVASELGKGTSFEIYLPQMCEHVAVGDPVNIERGVARGFETVLLVEDEDSVRLLAKRMLERAGYHVLSARHGGEALLIAEKHEGPIHLVLTDVVMPEIGGRELVERLMERHPAIRPLFMSGYSDEEVLRLDDWMSTVFFLQKPFSYEELTNKARRVLDATRKSYAPPVLSAAVN
ncbi:MAG: response regulator [Myxococcota bacterium]|jgi:PAS domain S-box-containing protein|nr:response regulator [Myxococcota bacterium]